MLGRRDNNVNWVLVGGCAGDVTCHTWPRHVNNIVTRHTFQSSHRHPWANEKQVLGHVISIDQLEASIESVPTLLDRLAPSSSLHGCDSI